MCMCVCVRACVCVCVRRSLEFEAVVSGNAQTKAFDVRLSYGNTCSSCVQLAHKLSLAVEW